MSNIDFLIGHQPLNNRSVDTTGIMFYLMSQLFAAPHLMNAACVETEIKQMKFHNGDGAVSARDILLRMDALPETQVMQLIAETAYVKIRRYEKVHVDGMGDFMVHASTVAITKPIFSYVDKHGLDRYIASPEIHNLVFRLMP